jgi:thiol-disulfide isomerase/thioredoxin
MLKRGAIALGIGLLAAVISVGASALRSNDLRVMYGAGALALFLSAFWLQRWKSLLLIVIAAVPALLLFGLAVLPQLPSTWPSLLLLVLATVAGAMLAGGNERRVPGGVLLTIAVALSGWYVARGLPNAISASLTHRVSRPAPPFAFVSLDGSPHDKASLAGKTVVLDFFATWCVPCRAELPEMAKVRSYFANDPSVVFFVVADGSGGDTPDLVRRFATQRGLGMPFAFDAGGKAHALFGLSGVPTLVVIDPHGQVRLLHQGYNAAETRFGATLRETLEMLRKDG